MKKSEKDARKDARFEEAKLEMVMKLKNISREEAEKAISPRRIVCTDIVKRQDDDLLISADEFFGGL